MIVSPPKKIHIKSSSVHGRGIFASEDIQKGELIETAPIAIMQKNYKQPHEWSSPDLMFLRYNSGWGTWLEENLTCMTFGYASLYNHSDLPNVEYKKDFENEAINFYAKENIKAGEECFIFYWKNFKTAFAREDIDDKEN